MNIELKKVKWAEGNAPGSPQTLSLSYRKQDAPDNADSYTLVTDSLFVLTNGTVVNPVTIKGLDNNTPYVFRLTNANVFGGKLDVVYNTPNELVFAPAGNEYMPNSRIDGVKTEGSFYTGMVPPDGIAFYSVENDFRDLLGSHGNLQVAGNAILKKALGYTGMYIDCQTDKMFVPDLNIPAIVTNNASYNYGLGVYFYVASADLGTSGTWPLLSSMDASGNGLLVYVDNTSKKVVFQHKYNSSTVTVTAIGTVVPDSWNNLLVGHYANPNSNPNNPTSLYYNYLNGNTITNTVTNAAIFFPTLSAASPLTVGAASVGTGYNGKGIFRNLYVAGLVSPFTDGTFYNLSAPVGYLQSTSNTASILAIPHENLIAVNENKISFTLPQTLPAGGYNFYVMNNYETTAPVKIYVNAVTKAGSAYDIDFTQPTETYDPVDAFQSEYYALGENRDGGADGGVVPQNIYFKDGLLTLEAHGDWYDGLVQGLDTNGSTKKHEVPGDPLLGESWKTRVGAAVTSKKYYGYGRFIVEAKLPKLTGVSPFFRLYHHATARFQDPYYQTALSNGLHGQGSTLDPEGFYVREKNEFGMELPANNAVYIFNTMSELLQATYLYPYAGLKVIIQNDTDLVNGTWQLNTPASPKLATSWIKFSNDVQYLKQPRRDQLRIINSKGELGEGVGFTLNPVSVPNMEEFLEMRASIGKDVWDDAYHEFRMDWYANRVEYYIDGVLIQTNNSFVPDIAGRFSFGLSFPSAPLANSPWLTDPEKLSAGPAAWHHQTMTVKRVAFTPFTDTVAGGTNRLIGETEPFEGLYRFPYVPM